MRFVQVARSRFKALRCENAPQSEAEEGVTEPFEVGKEPAMVALLEAKEAMFSRDLETQNGTGSNRKRAREPER